MLSRTASVPTVRRLPLLVPVLLLSLTGAACSDDPRPQAAPSPSAVVASEPPSPPPSPSPTSVAVRLTGDGIDTPEQVLAFGDAFEIAEPALRTALGEPTLDTGEQEAFSTYGTCPGSRLRALEYGGGALYVLFGDVIGPGMTMYQWTLTEQGRPAEVPQASALIGDVTTFEFGVGDTVARLRAGVEGSELEVREGDEMFPPSFTLTDQSSGFYGFLTGTEPAATIAGVQAGEACGE